MGIDVIRPGDWPKLAKLTDSPVSGLRYRLNLLMAALEQCGYELQVKDSPVRALRLGMDQAQATAVILDVLERIAEFRDCGMDISAEDEATQVFQALRGETQLAKGA